MPECVHTAFEANSFQSQAVIGGGLSGGAADQILRDQAHEQFFLSHLGRTSTSDTF